MWNNTVNFLLQKNIIIKKEEPNSDSETQITSFTEYKATDIKEEEVFVPAPSSGLKSETSVSIICFRAFSVLSFNPQVGALVHIECQN
jgi:hypothetical protein